MSIRSVALGLLLAGIICGLSYYNDQVVFQTYLIGNHLPIVVFGAVVLLLLAFNPLLDAIRRGWALRAAEVAVIAAIGLSVCGWPSSNLLRYYTGVMALPAHKAPTMPAWQASGVMDRLPGEGLLLNDGAYEPLTHDRLIAGSDQTVWPTDVPWAAWWPTLRLWMGVSALLGLASLCLVLIVHPQWSKREHLLYPTVMFVDLLARRSPGRKLPDIAGSKLFWIAFALVVGFHLITGLNKWFPELPYITRQFDFRPLRVLTPNIARVSHSHFFFHPVIYPSVIGFAFFINTRVAMSLGLSLPVWLLLGGTMLSLGVPLQGGHFNIGANGTFMRMGSYLAATVMILYYGRRYYLRLSGAAIGLKRTADTPAYAVWAARGLVLCLLLCSALLVQYAGMSVLMSVLLLGMLMMIFLVLTRINAETGLFYAQPDFLPAMMIAGFFGVTGVGVESLIAMTIASIVLVADPREAFMPYLANAVELVQRVGRSAPTKIAPLMAVTMIAGLALALVVTLTLQYNVGLNQRDGWANWLLPNRAMSVPSQEISAMAASGELEASESLSSFEQLSRMSPEPGAWGWTLAGFGLLIGCAAARLRLPWWPIHPILFLVWGTWPASNFAVSFLIGAMVKWSVVRLGGEQSYRTVRPFMVGLIAGELLAAIGWSIVGMTYYAATGVSPEVYRILP